MVLELTIGKLITCLLVVRRYYDLLAVRCFLNFRFLKETDQIDVCFTEVCSTLTMSRFYPFLPTKNIGILVRVDGKVEE
jgi:hypothetical protein